MLSSLLKPATKYQVRKYRKLQRNTREDSARICELHPELALEFKKADLFNFTYHAVYTRDEKMLDELWREHEQLAPGNKLFNNQVNFCRAKLRIHQLKFGEAIEILKNLAAEEDCISRENVLLYLIELYAKENDYKSAAQYVHAFMEHTDRENRREKAWSNLGVLPYLLEVLGTAGEYENVIAIGKTRLALMDNECKVWYAVGLSYLKLGDDLRALHYFTEALKRNPKLPEVYMQMAEFYWNTKNDFQKAIEYSQQALKLCGEDDDYKKLSVVIYRNLANLYRLAHDLDRAGEYRRKQFAAMDSLALFDLVAFFGDDEQGLNEFRVWTENHPEAYDEFLNNEADEDGFYEDEDD